MVRRFADIAQIAGAAAALTVAAVAAPAAAQAPKPDEAAFRALFKELVETPTAYPNGDCTKAVTRVAARMKAAGFPEDDLHIFTPEGHPKEGALVAIYPGRDPKLKAVLMLAHIDVVAAKREDWTRDPYVLVEENGYFFGRGVSDMKAQAAIWADNLIRYNQQRYKPLRTVKMALTCGEEGLFVNGARWLIANQRDLIDAGIGLNEGGGGELDANGKPVVLGMKAAEKNSANFTFEVTNPGGHSSRPRPDNAIYSLSRALDRVSRNKFPIMFIDANRGYFSAMSKIVGGEQGAAMAALVANPKDAAADAIVTRDDNWNGMLRTTCVATTLSAGHAGNALPQRATANVNCRIFPGVGVDEVRSELVRLVNDPEVKITTEVTATPSKFPPVTEAAMGPLRKVAAEMWPGVPVVPNMTTASGDAKPMNMAGIVTYGQSGLFRDPDGGNAHGLNERVRVKSVMEGREFLFRLVKAYADQKD